MNILEKALKELDFEYETDGKYYKIPTNNENLKKILQYTISMQLDLQQKIDKAIEYIKENANYGIQEKCCLDDLNYYNCDELLEILGDDESVK